MDAHKYINRNNGSRYILFPAAVLTALFISSCEKDDGGIRFDSLPGTYVLTIDHDESNFQYPYYSSGIVIYRGTVPKSYSLRNLAGEKDCAWKIVRNGLYGSEAYFSFQSYSNPGIWWSIGTTSNIYGEQEFYLGTEETNNTPDEDWSWFIIHDVGKSGGKKEIVIESVAYPGHYLENLGHTLTGNGLRFVSRDQPEKATRFQLNDNVVGSKIGGI